MNGSGVEIWKNELRYVRDNSCVTEFKLVQGFVRGKVPISALAKSRYEPTRKKGEYYT
jgi:hypothetical protein